MKKWALLLCVMTTIVFAAEPWRTNYDTAMGLMANGKYEEAVSFLKMSVADKPICDVGEENDKTFEYLPYLYLGICYYHLDKLHLASGYFEMENTLPAIEKSGKGRELMQEYKQKVEQKHSTEVHEAQKMIRDFNRRPYLLSDEEVKTIKEEVRTRCALPSVEETSYPWYYHYELGLTMARKNDWQRALDSFLGALDHREQSEKFSRIYGMWFIDYYPYYNIGLAHCKLKNWNCALNSFRLSQMLEDISRKSKEYAMLQQYQSQAEKAAGH